MFGLKKLKSYIIKFILDEIKKEVNEDSQFSLNVERYKYNNSKEKKINPWKIHETFEIDEFSIEIKWVYTNGVADKKRYKFENFQALKEFVDTPRTMQPDVLGITKVDFEVWYNFKTSKRNLSVHRFLDTSNSKAYGIEVVNDANSIISKWIDKNMEYVI